ncbi:gamma-glutamylcyclotransferase family protein [Saccharothrix sp. BKS2]
MHGDPTPDDWPDRLFVYGTLQPGMGAWSLVEPFVLDDPEPAALPGALHDTGLGYPALRPAGGPLVPGHLLRLAHPEDALPVLDEYEGDEYARVRVALPDGRVCWTYVWTAEVGDMPRLEGGWVGNYR